MAQLHRIVRNRRKQKGFTQKELARELNVSDKTISKWETGRGTPDITMVKRLSRVLGVSPNVFLEDDADASNPYEATSQSYDKRVVHTPEASRSYVDTLYFKRMFIVASALLIPFIVFGTLVRSLQRFGFSLYRLGPFISLMMMVFTLILFFSSVLIIGMAFLKYKNAHPNTMSKEVYVMTNLYLVFMMVSLNGILTPFLWGLYTLEIFSFFGASPVAMITVFANSFLPSSLWFFGGLIALQAAGIVLMPVFKLKIRRDPVQLILLIMSSLILFLVLYLVINPNPILSNNGPFLQKLTRILSPFNRLGGVPITTLFLFFNVFIRILFMRSEKIESYDTPKNHAFNQQ
ncbi:MAG: helix-turn-helix domain-containing protein [Bacillota bacterium]